MEPTKRSAFLATALAALIGSLVAEGSALGATTRTVHVGRGGTQFVDDVSATNVSTIEVGDTIDWVWEGTMEHSVTSGTCPAGGGGGGGGYGSYSTCVEGFTWQSTGPRPSGFTFSHTFMTAGTFNYYCAVHGSAMTGKVVVQAPVATGPCVADDFTLCLNNGRFAVTANWTKSDGGSGRGNAIKLTGDSGYFWFFDPANIELVTKVLNGCVPNNSYWVFGAGLTNVQVDLNVLDTQTGIPYSQHNPLNTPFVPIQDTGAFPTSCP